MDVLDPKSAKPYEKANRRALAAEPGSVLAGKYRIESLLGRGGMGQVFLATHLQLNEPLAIKLLHRNLIDSPETLDRFLQEGRAAAKIKSEHIARVLDLGMLEDGSPYMAMEVLEGSDLAKTLKKDGPLPIPKAVDFILQACEALSAAHSIGIIHRDLKPSNLFLTQRADGTPWIKVLDFGISKFLHAGHSHTQTSDVLGSPPYMSPEQIRSTKHVDHRSDIWSLGTILFELLTGRTPFMADTMADLCIKIVAEPSPPLSSVLPGAPPGLEAILLKCHEKDPGARYASVEDLASALKPYVMSAQRTVAAGPVMESLRKSGAAAVKTVMASPADLLHVSNSSANQNNPISTYPETSRAGNTSVKWNNSIDNKPAQGSARKNSWLIPSIALGAIFIIGIAAFLGWRVGRAEEERQSSAESSPIALPAAASVTELAPMPVESESAAPPMAVASEKPKTPAKPPPAKQPAAASTKPKVGFDLFNDRK